jgi:hypothetical protein
MPGADSPNQSSRVEVWIAIVGAAATVLTAIVSGVFSYLAVQKSDAVEQRIEGLKFIAGTINTPEEVTFGPLPAGFERDLTPNWRVWRTTVSYRETWNKATNSEFQDFKKPPQVFVTLKSLDASNLSGRGPRVSLAAPPRDVTRDNFTLYIYTWLDDQNMQHAPGWIEVSWFAFSKE